MAFVDLQKVSKQYDAVKILNEVSIAISEGERVAIVGRNGSGKSTLMKIVLGREQSDEGERIVQNGVTIEMLAQAPKFDPEITVREAVEKELAELTKKKEEFERLSALLTENADNEDLARELTLCSNYIDHHNGWNIDDRVERVLVEFSLKEFENRSVVSLSGGEQRRVALAGLLLKKPDLLLLDEPTNHLDVYMVKFLEEMLLREKFTLLFISHDRYFIDRLATKTVEVDESKIRAFKGGYSRFLEAKQQLLETMEKQYDNLLRTLKTEMEWLNRGVKARLKRNEGRKKRAIELKESVRQNPTAIRKIKVQLQREQKAFNKEDSINKKKMLFEIENLNFSLGDKKLVENFNTRILFHDKIAVVGKNGSGKSSFLKLLLGQYKQTSGSIKSGEFSIGYFDQHRDMLDDNKDIMETFCPYGGDRVEVDGKNMHVYGYLKNWLFPKEFLDKKIGTLSGGEKNRVALAWLFTKKYDCLIVDEPTNDLDIPTINILEEYLVNFQGALIFVSHDRYFVDKIAKKLLIFKGNGQIEESMQEYSHYLEVEDELLELDTIKPAKEEALKGKKERKQTKLSYKEKILYDTLPEEIEKLETQLEELEACISDPERYKNEGLSAVSEKYRQTKDLLDEKVEHFLELEEKVEEFGNS